MKPSVTIFWFRRDLRLHDNAGLYHALKKGPSVQPVFIFDKNILDELEDKSDARVQFIYDALLKLQSTLLAMGATLNVRFGTPKEVFSDLLNDYEINSVFTNHDYEPLHHASNSFSLLRQLIASYSGLNDCATTFGKCHNII